MTDSAIATYDDLPTEPPCRHTAQANEYAGLDSLTGPEIDAYITQRLRDLEAPEAARLLDEAGIPAGIAGQLADIATMPNPRGWLQRLHAEITATLRLQIEAEL
jgi:hypothetical protein